MKYAVLTVVSLMMFSAAAAHEFNPENLEEGNLDHYQNEINIYSDETPDFLASIVGNQTINVDIDYENGTDKQVGVRMQGTAVSGMKMGSYDNATLEVNTSVRQINNITTSDEPIKTLNHELKEGDVEYKSNGMLNSLRTFIAEQLLAIFAS